MGVSADVLLGVNTTEQIARLSDIYRLISTCRVVHKRYDPIRDTERFQKVVETIENMAK